MKVLRCYDPEKIKEIFTHPDIWETIAEDGQSPDDFEPDVNADCYMMCIARKLVGFYVLRPINSVTLDIHAQILPEYRRAYSVDSAQAILEWFNTECPDKYQKLVCDIPEIYPNVRDFCLKVGFKHEGFSVKSYRKNGKIVGRWLLGYVRQQ